MTNTVQTSGCGAPAQGSVLPASVDLGNQTVITGCVLDPGGVPTAGAYVRLLDSSGEFTAEVVSGDDGVFRFYAAEGKWTVRALSRDGSGETVVAAKVGLNETEVAISQ